MNMVKLCYCCWTCRRSTFECWAEDEYQLLENFTAAAAETSAKKSGNTTKSLSADGGRPALRLFKKCPLTCIKNISESLNETKQISTTTEILQNKKSLSLKCIYVSICVSSY